MAKIFITGVAGFLGSHISDRMLQLGHEVVGCDNFIGGYVDNINRHVQFHPYDCNDLNGIKKIMEGCDIVYHCAATAYEGLSVFSPTIVTKNIVTSSVSVFTAAISNNVKRIINCSSMARYGTNEVPFRETYIPNPQDPYGIGKVCAENMLKNLCEIHDTEYVIAVPHNIIGPRQKYCMEGTSLVKLETGFKPIKNVEIGDKISIQDKVANVLDIIKLGKKKCFKLTLSNGQTVVVGKNHKFKTIVKDDIIWKEICKLNIDDYIISEKNSILQNCDRNSFDYKYGQFLGLLISDGTYNDKYEASIACCIEEDKIDIRNLLTELNFKYTETSRGSFKFYGKSLIDGFRELGLKGTAPTKIIPEQILQMSHETIIGVLSGLFSGDGWVIKTGNKIGFASVSEILVRQVQKILLNYGITSKISVRTPKPTIIEERKLENLLPIWNLVILSSNIEHFKNIGFVYKRKQNILEEKQNILPSKTIPNLGNYLNEIKLFFPLSIRNKCPNVFNTPRKNITEFSLNQILELIDGWILSEESLICEEYTSFILNQKNKLVQILNYGHFLKIKNIEEIEEELYDITVDADHHSYVGDGLICHNCDPFRNVASIMINLMLQGRQPIIYGDGTQKRCFSFIQDDIDILEKFAFEEGISGEIFNIGPDEEFVTINELAATIADLIGFELDPIYVKGRPQEVFLANCSADKIREKFGYTTKYTLREGLTEMIEYIDKRGTKPFTYHLDLEIINDLTPVTWKNKLF